MLSPLDPNHPHYALLQTTRAGNKKLMEERVMREVEARKAEENREKELQETVRKAEEARVKQQQETARQAEEVRLKQQQEIVRQAEEVRLKQQQETARQAEEVRLKEQQEALLREQEARLKQQEEDLLREQAAKLEALRQAEVQAEEAGLKQQEEEHNLFGQPIQPIRRSSVPVGPEQENWGATSTMVGQAEAHINDGILGDIIKLVREGNDKIQQPIEKGILLLGKTGSGKSTLATLLAGRKLQAIRDEQKGGFIIDAIIPQKDIIISNNKVAETKIPNKCFAGDVVIWDCPGFHDNRGVVQEIANGFYIKRLFETTKALKFVLVIPESALYDNRGTGFIDTVKQLIRSFADISVIEKSVSLVVTGVSDGKQPIHIINSIKSILSENELLTPALTNTIEYLLKSVHIFNRPNAEGPLNIEYDFLAEISKATEYAVDISNHACISISDNAMDYVRYILKTAQKDFNEIVDIILKAASESHGCITSQNNRLIDSYKAIEKLLPESITRPSPKFSLEHKDNTSEEHLIDIAALSYLRKVVNDGSNISIDNTDDVLVFLNNILKAFEEYIGSGNRQQELLKSQIQGYAYVLNQQMEYIKFFSKLCGQEIPGYLSTLKEPIASCREAVSKNLEEAVKSIKIFPDHTDREYYKVALKYLELYSNQEWSAKAQAKIYIYLGDLSENSNEAGGHYLKSMRLDKTLPITYSKLGDLLFKGKDYKAAIDCYKAINNHPKIEICFKQLLMLRPESVDQYMVAAGYFVSIGRYEKATKLYYNAFSLSQDEGVKATVLHNISTIMRGSQEKSVQLAEKAEARDFYDFDLVDPDALQAALMGEHVSVHL